VRIIVVVLYPTCVNVALYCLAHDLHHNLQFFVQFVSAPFFTHWLHLQLVLVKRKDGDLTSVLSSTGAAAEPGAVAPRTEPESKEAVVGESCSPLAVAMSC
jgi:hypothetical protein